MSQPLKFFQNTIAIVYDFDGTLSPQPMQEYTVLPHLGLSPTDFWKEVNDESAKTGSDPMLTYMRLIIEKIEKNALHVTRREFAEMAKRIRYFPGVESWFPHMNAHVRARGRGRVKLAHYLVSAGQKEILEGVPIRRFFKQIYASEYYFNHHGVATFPKFLITDTMKTQFLFRVNKGKEQLSESINEHMPEKERPIPFSNMIYIGDGMTDVPSMALAKKNGGHTIAVYNPKKSRSVEICKSLLQANRVDFIAPANYTKTSRLAKRVVMLLDSMIAGIAYQKELFDCKIEHDLPV